MLSFINICGTTSLETQGKIWDNQRLFWDACSVMPKWSNVSKIFDSLVKHSKHWVACTDSECMPTLNSHEHTCVGNKQIKDNNKYLAEMYLYRVCLRKT